MTEKTKTAAVSANRAFVEFPLDTWGFSTELRAAGLQAASNIRGDEDKHAIFMQTLRILAQHAQARLTVDQEAKAAFGAEIAAREASQLQRPNGAGPAKADD